MPESSKLFSTANAPELAGDLHVRTDFLESPAKRRRQVVADLSDGRLHISTRFQGDREFKPLVTFDAANLEEVEGAVTDLLQGKENASGRSGADRYFKQSKDFFTVEAESERKVTRAELEGVLSVVKHARAVLSE